MALPAGLAALVKRWELDSSTQDEGFAADTARVTFGPIDPATFEDLTDYFSNASHADAFEVIVSLNGQDVTLFTGPVMSWTYQFGNGVLEAADQRAILSRSPADDAMVFPGVEVRATGRTPQSTFADVVTHVANQTGVPIYNIGGTDYTLSGPAWPQTMSWGQFLGWLMNPLQKVRSTRADLVRRGDTIQLQRRSLVLGSPDVTVDFATIFPESFEIKRTRPKAVAVPVAVDAPNYGRMNRVAEFGGRSAESPIDTWGFRTEHLVLADGYIDRTFLHGRIQSEVANRITPQGATEVDTMTARYVDTLLGPRYEGRDISKSVGGIEVLRQQQRVLRNSLGALVGEYTVTDSRPYTVTSGGAVTLGADPSFRRTESVYETKARAGGGTITSRGRYSIGPGNIPVFDAPQHSYNAGDTHAVDDEFGNSPFGATVGAGIGTDGSLGTPFLQEPDDVAELRSDAQAESTRDLIEVRFDIPLLVSVLAGIVIEVSNCPVTINRFYVTHVNKYWDAESGHRMTVEGETWAS